MSTKFFQLGIFLTILYMSCTFHPISPGCKSSNDCVGNRQCVGGKCVECSSGEKKCDGNTVVICKGGGWEKNNCASDETCEKGKCQKVSSREGKEGGSCYSNGTCNSGLVCNVANKCEKKKDCKAGEKECNKNTAMTCKSDGTWEKRNCPSDEKCENGECKKNIPTVCKTGEKKCDGDNKVLICRADGKGWDTTNCPSGEICENGTCRKIVLPTQGLVAYWSFDLCNAKDDSGNGNDGKIIGTPQCINGKKGKALLFSGKDYYSLAKGMNFKEEFTYCFWLSLKEKACTESWTTLFLKGEHCPDGNTSNFKGASYEIAIGGQYKYKNPKGDFKGAGCNFINAYVYESPGNFYNDRIWISSSNSASLDTYKHICISYKNTKKSFYLYINGQKENVVHSYGGGGGNPEISPSDFSHIHQTSSSFTVGAGETYCNYQHKHSHFLKGTLDEIRVYNRTLSEKEINTIYLYSK